jgi:glycosyltransferase involved in cell wall biosynthesis
MTPIVSVCMISFNHEKYIDQAISSVLSQKTSFDFEVIIGDDFSSDDTYKICIKYANIDSRINLLPSECNIGIMPNLIRCMEKCRGEFIAICEGDDYWTDNNKLEKQVSFLIKNGFYSACAHQSEIVKGDSKLGRFGSHAKKIIQTDDLLGGRLFHTASFLCRRETILAFCGSPLVLSCDRLLFICASLKGPIYYSEDSMCVYRLHCGGISSKVSVGQLALDLNSVEYLSSVCIGFKKHKYKSYIYATMGMCQNGIWWSRVYYLMLSFLFSFSFFPANIFKVYSRMANTFKNKNKATN